MIQIYSNTKALLLFFMVAFTGVQVGGQKATETTYYQVKFVNNWNSENHPNNFPADAQWSAPVVVSHARSFHLWKTGSIASTGMKSFSETGKTRQLEKELNADMMGVGDCDSDPNSENFCSVLDFIIGEKQVNDEAQEQTIKGTLRVDKHHSHVSAIRKIVPSPDWFAGMQRLLLIEGGYWVDMASIDAYPFDAGTDGGTNYTSRKMPLKSPQTIHRLKAATVSQETKVFLNPTSFPVVVERLGSFELNRVSEPTLNSTYV